MGIEIMNAIMIGIIGIGILLLNYRISMIKENITRR